MRREACISPRRCLNCDIYIYIYFFFIYLNGPEQSSTERQAVGRNCRVNCYVHIPTGVRDGRDAILLFHEQFKIALLMGQHNVHEKGGSNPAALPLSLYIYIERERERNYLIVFLWNLTKYLRCKCCQNISLLTITNVILFLYIFI